MLLGLAMEQVYERDCKQEIHNKRICSHRQIVEKKYHWVVLLHIIAESLISHQENRSNAIKKLQNPEKKAPNNYEFI